MILRNALAIGRSERTRIWPIVRCLQSLLVDVARFAGLAASDMWSSPKRTPIRLWCVRKLYGSLGQTFASLPRNPSGWF
jgi:hypothetical protein